MGKKTRGRTKWIPIDIEDSENICGVGGGEVPIQEQAGTPSTLSPAPSPPIRPLVQFRRGRGTHQGGGARSRNNPGYHLYPGETLDGPRKILVENKQFTEGEYTKITTPRQEVLFKKEFSKSISIDNEKTLSDQAEANEVSAEEENENLEVEVDGIISTPDPIRLTTNLTITILSQDQSIMAPHTQEDEMGSVEDDTTAQTVVEARNETEEAEQSEEQEKPAEAPAPSTSRGKCVRFGGEQKMPDATPSANIIQNLAPHLPGMDPNSVYIVSGPFTYFDPQQNSYTGMLVAQPVPQGASVVAVPCGAPPSPSGDAYPGKACPIPAAWTQHDGKPFRNIHAPQYNSNPVPAQLSAPGQYQVTACSPHPQFTGMMGTPNSNVLMNPSPPVSTNTQHATTITEHQASNATTTMQQSSSMCAGYPQQAATSSSPRPTSIPPSSLTTNCTQQSVGGTQRPASNGMSAHLNPTANGMTGSQHAAASGKCGTQHPSSNGISGHQYPAANGMAGPQQPGVSGIAGSQQPIGNSMTGLQQPVVNGMNGTKHSAVNGMTNNQHKIVVMGQQPMNGQQMLINGLHQQGRKQQCSPSANTSDSSVPAPQYQYHNASAQVVDKTQANDSDLATTTHCPPTTSSHYQPTTTCQQPTYRRQNLQVVNNNNNITNNNKPPTNSKPKSAPVWRNCIQQNYVPICAPHQFQNGQFLNGQTHVVNGPVAPVNGHYAMNGHFPVMNGYSNHIQQVNGHSGQPVNMPQNPVSLSQNGMAIPQNQVTMQQNHIAVPQSQVNLQPSYGATLHLGGGQFATGSPAMRIPITNLGGGCPIHQPNMPLAPHIMHWDANHLSGHPVPLRQPNPPVYYNVPAPATYGGNNQQDPTQVQENGSGSQSPSSDMSAQTGSGGSDASSEESASYDMNGQQSLQYIQGGYSNGYPVQCVVHYGSPAPPAKEVYDIHGRKIHNFEQHFANRNMQVH